VNAYWSLVLYLMHGRGRDFRIAKNQFQKDFRRRPNKEAALTEFRQLHSRIGDTEAIQLAAHAVMIGKPKAHVVDSLTHAIGRTTVARVPVRRADLETASP